MSDIKIGEPSDVWAIRITAAQGVYPPQVEVNPGAEYNYLVRLLIDEVNRQLANMHSGRGGSDE